MRKYILYLNEGVFSSSYLEKIRDELCNSGVIEQDDKLAIIPVKGDTPD